MEHKIGYACINQSLGKDGSFKTITVKTASKLTKEALIRKVRGITLDNLYNTYKILQWNLEHNISMYRLSSSIIPLATHELLEDWQWWNDENIIKICVKIKKLVQDNGVRISFHPSQYTVINTPKEDVFTATIKDLEYHYKLSELIGNNSLILHTGGVYNAKERAIERFISNFRRLPKYIQDMMVLENDDKSYNVGEVLNICKVLNIPMCLDLHHHRVLPSENGIESYIDDIISTWGYRGVKPKCHLSSGKEHEKDKKHADYVSEEDYNWCVEATKDRFDIMFECKLKELSVLKYNK